MTSNFGSAFFLFAEGVGKPERSRFPAISFSEIVESARLTGPIAGFTF